MKIWVVVREQKGIEPAAFHRVVAAYSDEIKAHGRVLDEDRKLVMSLLFDEFKHISVETELDPEGS